MLSRLERIGIVRIVEEMAYLPGGCSKEYVLGYKDAFKAILKGLENELSKPDDEEFFSQPVNE